MYSVKPGRAPSFAGAFGGLISAAFGVCWVVVAISMGAPAIFPIFGVLFVLMGIAGSIYNFKNATSTNRFSAYEITGPGEEPDPLERSSSSAARQAEHVSGGFCPYCGTSVRPEFEFCPKCGKGIPTTHGE